MINQRNLKIQMHHKCIPALAALLLSAFSVQASYQLPAGTKSNSIVDLDVDGISLSQNGREILVNLGIDLSQVNMKSNLETVYTPMFACGPDTLKFESFTVTGRNRLYFNKRNGVLPDILFYKGDLVGETLPVQAGISGVNVTPNATPGSWRMEYSAPYQEWMQNATLLIESETRGCANCLKNIDGAPEQWYPVAQNQLITHEAFVPDFIYITPVAEAVKTREVSGRAFIDFKVNQTVILPDYRRNSVELAKIIATIDSVKNDKDITVTSLSIAGTASPEGSYSNNVRLAKGRTDALAEYVRKLYSFPKGFIKENYEPVDWKGLAEFLETGDIAHASEILAIVNGDLPPEQRNNKIRNTYPKEYKWLLDNVYPSLRHSDYAIEFEIKTYTEAEEIIEIMQTQPQKLSLAELFVAANSQPEGSELYNRAFEIAVAMYPNDETANLNAGVNALKRSDLISARRYLSKAGNAPEALYARAMTAYMQGDRDEAVDLLVNLTGSSDLSVATRAQAALDRIREAERPDELTFILL